MPRGITPRQPSRSGRQDKASRAKERLVKSSSTKTHSSKSGLSGAPVDRSTAKSSKTATKAPTSTSRKAAIVTKGYNPIAPERVSAILERLDARYPDVVCALHHSSAWELLVATILSAQCTDVRVNMVTPELFRRFPTPQAMAKARLPELEKLIRTTGSFRNKAKSIQGAARKILSDFGGTVPETLAELITI